MYVPKLMRVFLYQLHGWIGKYRVVWVDVERAQWDAIERLRVVEGYPTVSVLSWCSARLCMYV